mmetsp:Transcript_28811/g.27602  ORF Transcript_28811/g.27602 Transcript_28811/m.27602 type:complete len:975 (-) Transcript_28811:99-3023(-)
MGQDVSSILKGGFDNLKNVEVDPSDIYIPVSMRPILPFLEDALRNLCNAKVAPENSGLALGKIKLAIACINHAFKVINILNLLWDDEGQECLRKFTAIRSILAARFNIGIQPEFELIGYDKKKEPEQSHDVIIFEADEIFALGELQLAEGFRFDAMLSFHTACVYYRVMECLIPTLSAEINKRLKLAVSRSKQCSSLSHNFVREHFEGQSCSDVYEVHGANKLGKGSYGSVYLATERLTGDERAVKVMNVDRVTTYYLRKLHTEISVLKCLDHPNIIKLQDVFFGKRSVYLVTSLCRGGELLELLNVGTNDGFVFRDDKAAQLMRDMLRAVHYLHSKGIVHRDLKLENFLFEEKNTDSPLVLIDFGLSKFYDKEDKMNHRVGSCYYTAPEVLSDRYDYRCDTWSLGVLCYMLLSGSPPFFGKTVADVYEATLTKDPKFPDSKFRHLSPMCLDFMKKLLVKDPADRMTTGQALQHPFITRQEMSVCTAPRTTFPPTMPFLFLSFNPNPAPELLSRPTSPRSWGMIKLSAMNMDKGQSFPPGQSSRLTALKRPPSISHNVPIISLESATMIIDSIVMYMNADPLTRLTFEMVAHSLRQDQLGELRLEFQAIDVGGRGVVNIKDFESALKVAHNHPSYSKVDMPVAFEAMCVEWARGGALSHFTDTLNWDRGVGGCEEMMSSHNSSEDMNDGDGTDPIYNHFNKGKISRNLIDIIKDNRKNYKENKPPVRLGPSETNCAIKKKIVKEFQNTQECTLTYREFVAVAMLRRIFITKERVCSAFKHLDKGNLGYLTSEGLHDVLGDDIDRDTYERILVFSLQRMINKHGISVYSPPSPNMCLTIEQFLENWVHGISYEHEHGHLLSPCESRTPSPRGSNSTKSPNSSRIKDRVRSSSNSNATDLDSVSTVGTSVNGSRNSLGSNNTGSSGVSRRNTLTLTNPAYDSIRKDMVLTFEESLSKGLTTALAIAKNLTESPTGI